MFTINHETRRISFTYKDHETIITEFSEENLLYSYARLPQTYYLLNETLKESKMLLRLLDELFEDISSLGGGDVQAKFDKVSQFIIESNLLLHIEAMVANKVLDSVPELATEYHLPFNHMLNCDYVAATECLVFNKFLYIILMKCMENAYDRDKAGESIESANELLCKYYETVYSELRSLSAKAYVYVRTFSTNDSFDYFSLEKGEFIDSADDASCVQFYNLTSEEYIRPLTVPDNVVSHYYVMWNLFYCDAYHLPYETIDKLSTEMINICKLQLATSAMAKSQS